MDASSPRVIVFVAGERSRVEAAVEMARCLYRKRRLLFVCEPRQRGWLSEAVSENVVVVEQPFNPFGRKADALRKALQSAPIEACAVVVATFGFESSRFRLFALRLRSPRFVLLNTTSSGPTKEISRTSFVLATGATLFFRICCIVAGWISPLDQPLAVVLAWSARILTRLRSLVAVSRGKEIVHVLPTIGTGGVQKQLMLLLTHRSPAYNHRVVVMWSAERFFAPELTASGVPVYFLDAEGMRATVLKSADRWGTLSKLRPLLVIFRSAFPFCWEIMKLTFILRTLKPRPDIVHCWLLVANLAGSIAARLVGVRQVVTSVRNIQSEVEFNYYNPRWQRILECATVPLVSVITANASAVAVDYQAFTRVSARKVFTVPNGVDIAAFRLLTPQERLEKRRGLGLMSTDLIVGTVARLAPEKDFETFFRALALARPKLSSLRCLIVGDGPLRAHLETFCASLNLTASVQFLGERKDVGDLIQCYDVFLLSSFIEGMPNVVMESQLLGTPVVATRAGGTVDLIRDGETGLLAPLGDAESLAACLVRMLTEKELRDRVCRAAGEQIRNNYTVEQLVARTENIYDQLLAGSSGLNTRSCVE
jgi:glycosyltransferase involved in cell wall biosynthesis